jgi:transcriptional regulator with XRE-family HTH domain
MNKNKRGEALKTLLSRNIRLYRLHSGLSQAELAEKAGISVPYLGAVERGDKWPSPTTLAALAHGLGHEPYALLLPEGRSSQEIKKFIVKLEKDISALVNQSVKVLNTIAKESVPEKKEN